MRAGRITIPPKIEINELEAMSLLGANVAELREALVSLSGSLVTEALDSGERYWKLRHPSIRDAMAIHVAGRPDLIDIYLGGVKVPELLTEVVCGDVNIAGAKVQVPANRFPVVIAKLRGINLDDYGLHYNYISFLSKRCSLAFLASWFSSNPRDFDEMTKVYSVSNFNFCLILTRLHSLGCLPETHRTSYLLRSPQDSLH